MAEQASLFEDNPEYEAFVEKFKPKLTTDDCYTPPEIYDAVRDWACGEYGIDPSKIVRPFYPGGDYENFNYPADCVVLDNPPFSILSKITAFYLDRGIHFFLFAPSLTAFSGQNTLKMNHIFCNAQIVYENGAVVRTAFVTNLGDADIVCQISTELRDRLRTVEKAKKASKELPRYEYPDQVLTAAMMQKYDNYGVEMTVRRTECEFIRRLDSQKEKKKGIFGGGLLLSERATAERRTSNAWELSDREKEIVRRLGDG